MLSGEFKNCYGMKEFNLKEIDFTKDNKAIIYAPNGIIKTSLSNTFDDIAKGVATKDRIFTDEISVYNVNYRSSNYRSDTLSKKENIYVVQSFDEKIQLSQETVATLLADENTRKAYENLVSQFNEEIEEFKSKLSVLSGISAISLEAFLKSLFDLGSKSDWHDIFEKLTILKANREYLEFLTDIKYVEVINEKTEGILRDKEFCELLEKYIDKLNILIEDNELLSKKFNDYNAEELSKNLKKHNLFENGHKIILKDNTEITTLKEWEQEVKNQLDKVYSDAELGKSFKDINKKLSSNVDTRNLKEVIQENREIISYLNNVQVLKELFVVNYLNNLEKDLSHYINKINKYSADIKKLYETADKQAERWNRIVDEFNRRFNVPFTVKIKNKANFLLKDEAPNLYFTYTRGIGTSEEKTADLGKDELMKSLSMGERRAMYLLYVLFDLEILREKTSVEGALQHLIIVDDIADSFDYKNKYAIIEYLLDISKNTKIDLLILTHNFDFYRTTLSRLNIKRDNCYIIQKKDNEELKIEHFPYLKDYFSKCIVENIRSGQILTNESKIKLIASIPFYRNICEYVLQEDDYNNLTCLLHIKNLSIDTENLTIEDVWNLIPDNFKDSTSTFATDSNDNYIETIRSLATSIAVDLMEQVVLENKILLAIAIRLELEIFLKKILEDNDVSIECNGNQTREWSNLAKEYLDEETKQLVEEVNLMTPESIHVNTFMYEPIIDMSDWALKKLYNDVKKLNRFS